ncbi:MAG: dicarboxylate/amino acid:cation symporter [Planctomycetaceae bacterium]|nr:dicarboxylate/amino acid:cation symporter [Planctomycetaceae bacterium]
MRWPLHYQILAAMVTGAVVGLLANPGPSVLLDGRYERPADVKSGGAGPRHANGGLLEIVGDGSAGSQQEQSSADQTLPILDDDRLVDAEQGEVTNRTVRFRIESDGVHAVYSRNFRVGQISVPMVSRLVLGDPESLAKEHPWLKESFSDYEKSPARWLDGSARLIGGLFLRLLKMVTVPLIATSLVCAVAGLGAGGGLGGMFSRTLLYYMTTSLLAITTGLVLVNAIGPGVGAELPGAAGEVVGGAGQSLGSIFEGLLARLIPTNPLAALAEGEFLSIISFSILFGLFLQKNESHISQTLRLFFEDAFAVVMDLTQWVIRLAPIGVAAFMLSATVSQGRDVFGTLGWYMLTVFLALVVHAMVVLPLMLALVAKRHPVEYFKALSPALLTAFSTASSNGTLPLTMSCVEERAGIPRRVGAFVLPLGATVNMDGTALYEAVAVLFIAQAHPGVNLGLEQQILVALTALLASVGAAGIPHAGLVMMAIVLQAVGLPLESQGLILAVDRVLDMCRTSVNVWSDACGCAVVSRWENSDDSSPVAAEDLPAATDVRQDQSTSSA